MFVVAGIINALAIIGAYPYRHIRQIEDDLADVPAAIEPHKATMEQNPSTI